MELWDEGGHRLLLRGDSAYASDPAPMPASDSGVVSPYRVRRDSLILSDMQGWIGHDAPTAALAAYKQRSGADPRVFSFDLAGYGTLQFPERNVYCLAGFSDKALQTMRFLEEDKSALIREIESIEL